MFTPLFRYFTSALYNMLPGRRRAATGRGRMLHTGDSCSEGVYPVMGFRLSLRARGLSAGMDTHSPHVLPPWRGCLREVVSG